jgi:SAM-dependent methyltransferase
MTPLLAGRQEGRPYDAREYWQRRLGERFNLRGVGHIAFSESYNEWLYKRKAACLEQALAGVDLRNETVLDVGCGTGFFVRWYGERGASVDGVDITDVSVSRLREEFPQHRFEVGDIGSPEFPIRRRFDIVNIWDVLYHVVDDRRFETALRNLAASVAPGGRLILTDQLGGPGDTQEAAHVKRRCLARYQSLLPPQGLQLQQLLPLYFRLNQRRQGEAPGDSTVAEDFAHDARTGFIASRNLSLGVWRRE